MKHRGQATCGEAQEHLKTARDEFRKSVEGMLPPEFLEHRAQLARKC
jgi:hypothetical protein